jgi:23S rRNA (cytosine1962-C5)-methyltransferase
MHTTFPIAGEVALRRDHDRRLRGGHLWVYSNEIAPQDDPPPAGSLVRLVDHRGKALAVAAYHPHALIAARVWSRDPGAVIDEAWIADHIEAAARRRAVTCRGLDAMRLVHAEADGLPGLVVDRYRDLAVVQVTSAFGDRIVEVVTSTLVTRLGCTAVLARNDARGRQLEGLPSAVEVLFGEVPQHLEIDEGGCPVVFDPHGGQKTGLYLDMRPCRDAVAHAAPGATMLELYGHVGTASCRAAAAGAAAVTCVDSSAPACELAREAARRGGVSDRVNVIEADAREVLRDAEPGSMDVVLCDPPSLIKRRKDVRAGEEAYRRINHLALRVVRHGGLLFSASCSFHLSAGRHMELIAAVAHRQGRKVRVVRRGGAGPDHPIVPEHAETEYLSWCEVIVEDDGDR